MALAKPACCQRAVMVKKYHLKGGKEVPHISLTSYQQAHTHCSKMEMKMQPGRWRTRALQLGET